MKKKGLLILPLAMMLIVAVALSTATYAWFVVSADAKISTLTVQTSASDGLQIASYYTSATSGTMTLNGSKQWIGSTAGYGAELGFTTAMSTAYGVTGDGLAANMYTAASRSVTSYTTTATNVTWWADNNASLTGAEVFYSDASGTILAASGGYFTLGVYTGDAGQKEAVITTGNSNSAFYVRALRYPSVVITSANQATYFAQADTIYYSDEYAMTPYTESPFASDGKKGEAAVEQILGKYVRTSSETTFIETGWSYERNNAALTAGNIPHYLVSAVANSEYFSLNFALKTQRGMVASTERLATADIFLKKFTVTATGGMAASARIAIFGNTSSAYSAENSTLLAVYFPFSKAAWADSAWTNVLETPQTAYKIIGDAPAQGAGYAYGSTTSTDFATTNSAKMVVNNDPIYDAGQWKTATFYDVDKNTTWSTKTDYTTAQGTATTKLNSLGTFSAANTVLYYQMVIWFEGDDAECIGTFAGTGVTVDMAFDFYQRWTA